MGNKIIYNGKIYPTETGEDKNNVINTAFFGKENDWGPFIVEDDNISQINANNGEQQIIGDTRPRILVVQGIKMFLNAVPQANSVEDMNFLKNSIYTKWTLQNSLLRGSTSERGSLQVPYTTAQGEEPIKNVSYKMSIRNYTTSVLNFGIQVSVDNEKSWQWLGNGPTRDKFYSTTADYYTYAIAGNGAYSNSLLSFAVIQNPIYYGTFFVINQIVEASSEKYPYGYVLVTPYFSAFNNESCATNYAGGSNVEHCVVNGHNAGLQWWFSCGTLWSSSNVANSSLQFTIPFGTEDEKNYALGISEKYKRITAQEYEEMTGIVVPTAADINRHYEELQEDEEGGE